MISSRDITMPLINSGCEDIINEQKGRIKAMTSEFVLFVLIIQKIAASLMGSNK